MNSFKSLLGNTLLFLSLQSIPTFALDVKRDVIITDQTFLDGLSNESITIESGFSLQLLDGPNINLTGDLTVDGSLVIGSYTATNLKINIDSDTLTNNGNFYVMNFQATTTDTYTFNNLYNYGNIIMASNIQGVTDLLPTINDQFYNEGHIFILAANQIGFSTPKSGITNSGTIELEGTVSITVPMSGSGCVVSSGALSLDYSNNIDQTIVVNGGQFVILSGLESGNIPKVRVPGDASSPYILMKNSPTGAITYNATTGILTYPPYQIDIGLGYPTSGWKVSESQCTYTSDTTLPCFVFLAQTTAQSYPSNCAASLYPNGYPYFGFNATQPDFVPEFPTPYTTWVSSSKHLIEEIVSFYLTISSDGLPVTVKTTSIIPQSSSSLKLKSFSSLIALSSTSDNVISPHFSSVSSSRPIFASSSERSIPLSSTSDTITSFDFNTEAKSSYLISPSSTITASTELKFSAATDSVSVSNTPRSDLSSSTQKSEVSLTSILSDVSSSESESNTENHTPSLTTKSVTSSLNSLSSSSEPDTIALSGSSDQPSFDSATTSLSPDLSSDEISHVSTSVIPLSEELSSKSTSTMSASLSGTSLNSQFISTADLSHFTDYSQPSSRVDSTQTWIVVTITEFERTIHTSVFNFTPWTGFANVTASSIVVSLHGSKRS